MKMKRIYLRPETRVLQLRLNTFITVSPNPSQTTITNGNGEQEEVGNNGEGEGYKPSRTILWGDMSDDE